MPIWVLSECRLCRHLRRNTKKRPEGERVYLLHADELRYDMFGRNPDAQIVKGKVSFMHQGGHLTCDSAYFYQGTNSVKAFGHVHYRQGDTLSLTCERAEYDGHDADDACPQECGIAPSQTDLEVRIAWISTAYITWRTSLTEVRSSMVRTDWFPTGENIIPRPERQSLSSM